MRVTWVTGSTFTKPQLIRDERGKLNLSYLLLSARASDRLRIFIPAAGVDSPSQRVTIFSMHRNLAASESLPPSDVVILGKTIFDEDGVLLKNCMDRIAAAKAEGSSVIIDYCDDRITQGGRMAEMYRTFLAAADHITVNSPVMKNILLSQVGGDISVIVDPVEGARREPAFSPTKPLRALWFGHENNLLQIGAALPDLARIAQIHPIDLTLLSVLDQSQIAWLGAVTKQLSRPELLLRYRPWKGQGTVHSALAETDLVVLPANSDTMKEAASHNRLIESLWGGRFVVAGPVPSYTEFSDIAYIDEDVAPGILWALENPQAVVERIQRGQERIAGEFSQFSVASQWSRLIDRVGSSPDKARGL